MKSMSRSSYRFTGSQWVRHRVTFMMVGDSAPKDTFGCHDLIRKEDISGT